ncbi:hypothetical protein [Streptomyces cremeus]|uniref:Uncharacterized protein n=1 Tax=Streptomyces cremeus TaxID=66881 RepID=A0ABV5PCM5_STRCM
MKPTGQTSLHEASGGARIAAWLAHAHRTPSVAEEEWDARRVAMLPLGRRFDAVRIPAEVVHAGLGTDNRDAVGALLSTMLGGGPVIQDSDTVYALVAPGQAEKWAAPTGSYRWRGWLTVPRPDQLAEPGVHWLTEMSRPGRLCDLDAVARVAARGFTALSEGRV